MTLAFATLWLDVASDMGDPFGFVHEGDPGLPRLADGVHLTLYSVVHFLDGNCPQAIRLVKNAIIEARAARKLRTNHDLILWTAWAIPLRPLRAKDGYHWNV